MYCKFYQAASISLSFLILTLYSLVAEASACSFALTDTSTVISQTPDWEYDFELGWNSEYGQGGLANQNPSAPEWRYAQMQTDAAGAAVVDPLDPTNQAMRFLWQKGAGTEYDSNTQKKAHLYGEFGVHHSVQEIWSFDVLFPSTGMQSDPQPAIIAQWHGVPDAGEEFRRPPIAVDNKNDRLTLSWLYDERQITPAGFEDWDVESRDLGATTKDQWINFVFQMKYDPWGCGAIKVIRDGSVIVDESEIAIGFNDQIGAYLGFGIYQFTGDSAYLQRSIYFDNVKQWIVDPSAPELTADFNFSATVDDIDFTILEKGFSTGTTHGQGDADRDGDVDGIDFLIWQRQVGREASMSATVVSVPEPAAMLLLVSLLIAMLMARPRRYPAR